jgi:hypothetical protein
MLRTLVMARFFAPPGGRGACGSENSSYNAQLCRALPLHRSVGGASMCRRHSISTIRVALLGHGAGSRSPRAVLCTKVELFVNKVQTSSAPGPRRGNIEPEQRHALSRQIFCL